MYVPTETNSSRRNSATKTPTFDRMVKAYLENDKEG